MDRQTLSATLDAHLKDGKLELPPDALQSDPVRRQLELALGGENLLIDPVADRQQDDSSDTVSGTCRNTLFKGMSVAARFTAGDPAGLSLSAEAAPGWTQSEGFPRLRHTLADALRFNDARWQLLSAADGETPAGLSFRGTLDTANSLGFFIFLIGDTDEVLTGAVETVEESIPTMRLAGGVRGGTSFSFVSLGPVSLALLTLALDPLKEGGPKRAAVRMEVSTSIDFVAQGETRQIPLTAGIYSGSSSITLEADTAQLMSAGIDELAALVGGVDLGGISFGDFNLESVLKLAAVTFTLDPLSATKLTSVLLTVESAKSWDILSRGDGQPFLTLQSISVAFGISAPFTSQELTATLKGQLLLGGSRLNVEAGYSSQGVLLRSYLDPATPLSLRDVAAALLGETDPHTPALSFGEFDLLVEPGRNYQLNAEVTDLWSIELGDVSLDLKSLSVDWQYAVGQQAQARIAGQMQFGGVDIDVLATYSTTGGWDFTGGLAPGQSVPVGQVLADLVYYFGVEPPSFLDAVTLDTLTVGFNTTSKSFDFTLGGGLPVEDKWLEITVGAALRSSNNKFEMELTGSLTIGDMVFTITFEKGGEGNTFLAAYQHTGAPTSIPLRDFVSENLSSSVAEIVPEKLAVDIKDLMFAFTTPAAQPADGQQSSGGQQAATTTPASKFLFALDLSAAVSLSDLPLVGRKFPSDQAAGVEGLRLLVTSAPLTRAEAATFDALMPVGMTRLTVPSVGATNAQTNAQTTTQTTTTAGTGTTQAAANAEVVIARGLTVSALMNFGGSLQPLSLPVTSSSSAQTTGTGTTTTTTATTTGAAPVTSSDNAQWFQLQKGFGPVFFEKVGVKYQDEVVWFLLTASLSAAGLTLTLDGLGVGSKVKGFDPQFDLRGLGVQYKGGGGVEVGGALLRTRVKRADNPEEFYDEYDGAAFVKAGQLKISALGSYAELDGHPSLFVYAVLDYPIGGPSFFFVTGLAAGFGYNRLLVVPAIDQVAQFPLVADAVGGAAMPANVSGKVAALQRYIPPSAGDYFLAVGIKFTSFKLIDSFALLTVSFGTQFEVNLLGLSTLIVPTPIPGEPPVTPLAEIQLAVRATYNPSQGFLGIAAQLTSNSFLLSRDCRLTGGFAFYSWFSGEHEGDFVLTLGGYHPDYKVPAHYPAVPRLGFNWRVDSKLTIKGGMYYALTAAALMAGGSLQATWDDGDIKAHFTAGADFIIYWKPYHYDAKVYVDIGVSYTYNLFGRHTLNVDVGADLHIWGPEFAGTARVKLSIISFDISFGDGSSKTLQAIDWTTFQQSFLPKQKDGQLAICTVSVSDGLLSVPPPAEEEGAASADGQQGEGTDAVQGDDIKVDWYVNPKSFLLVTNSVIPSKEAYKANFEKPEERTAADLGAANTTVGVAPMALKTGDFSSSHTVSFGRRNGEEGWDDVGADFDLKPVLKDVPVALWGETLTPSLNGPAFVKGALAGFEVRAHKAPDPGVTADIERKVLQYETETVADAFAWESFRAFEAKTYGGADEEAEEAARSADILATINADATVAARARLLGALGVGDPVELTGYGSDGFIIPPQVEAA
ncbi:MAG TPA: DUF6603 domain-containing protein [Pyrinomonadaceae bacterium]|nr:DUF6603 domain-containing protein [Pyrinomonadaceae bacterium]